MDFGAAKIRLFKGKVGEIAGLKHAIFHAKGEKALICLVKIKANELTTFKDDVIKAKAINLDKAQIAAHEAAVCKTCTSKVAMYKASARECLVLDCSILEYLILHAHSTQDEFSLDYAGNESFYENRSDTLKFLS